MTYYQTTKLNKGETYNHKIQDISLETNNLFCAKEGEVALLEKRSSSDVNAKNVFDRLDEVDHEIIWRTIYCRFITPEQLLKFLKMQGIAFDMHHLNLRLDFLNHQRVLWRGYITNQDNVNITFLEMDILGKRFVEEAGVILYDGLAHKKRMENTQKETLEIPIKAMDVKKYLMANQILLGLLKNGAVVERFSFQEILKIMQGNDWTDRGKSFRSNLKVDIDKESVLSYWIIRECDNMLKELKNKLVRYYSLLEDTYYLVDNAHRDLEYPQVVICGETEEQNYKIYEFLKKQNLIRERVQLLYTEDAFYFGGEDSTKALYEIDQEGQKIWYGMPKK